MRKNTPPRLADTLLRLLCKPEILEGVIGDLHEYYQQNNSSSFKKRTLYWFQVLNLLRPFAIKSIGIKGWKFSPLLRINFIISFRYLKKNSLFSSINIVGLSLSLFSSLLIMEYIRFENSFDKFHEDHHRIYRIDQITTQGSVDHSATTFSRVAEELNLSFPSVEAACRVHKVRGNVVVTAGDKVFREEGIIGADSSFFSLFKLPLVAGAPEHTLREARSLVISKSIALKYFGTNDPIGKQMTIDGAYGFWSATGYNNHVTYTITGVVEDLPPNSHLKFDFLISLNLYSQLENELQNWGDSFYTYYKSKHSDDSSIIAGLEKIISKYKPDQEMALIPKPLTDIHLGSNLANEFQPNGSIKEIWLMATVAIVIIIVAGTNYINFTRANAQKRSTEIAVGRVFWASSSHIFNRIFIEGLVINTISMALVLLLLFVAEPLISPLLGHRIDLENVPPDFWSIAVLSYLVGIGISAIYPAIIISKLKLDKAQKVNLTEQFSIQSKSNLLVGFQFTLSLLVLGFSIITLDQMKFVSSKEVGANIFNTIVIPGPTVDTGNDSIYDARLTNFKTTVSKLNNVSNVTLGNFLPGQEIRGQATGYVRKIGDQEESAGNYYFTQVDYEFLSELEFSFIAGRNFDQSFSTDQQAIVINKAASDLLGFGSPEEAIGNKIIYRRNSTPMIIGVVDDFHQQSLRREYQPIIFEVRSNPKGYCYLKFATGSQLPRMNEIQRIWGEVFEGNPFNYFLLEDFYSRQYEPDNRFSKVFALFSIFSVSIVIIGIFGLTYINAASRVKEIGVRKTLGASVFHVFYTLFNKIGIMILLASIIAIPLIYMVAEDWLMNYAFRISIKWWMIAGPIALLLMLAVLVVGVQSIRSYRLNLSKALKNE